MQTQPFSFPVVQIPSTNNTPYIIVVGVMFAIAIGAVIIINSFGGHLNDIEIISIIVGLLTSTTMSILSFMKSQETHKVVNSRIDEFKETLNTLAETQSFIARAEGKTEGRAEANARTDALEKMPDVETKGTTDPGKGETPDSITVQSDETLVIKKAK